jgi:uncharacterized membrane protein YeaQ/YmgE (transglycosylase-associated protein family)
MTRSELIKMISWLTLGFVAGFLASMLVGANYRSHGSSQKFNASGFGASLYNEAQVQIKAIDGSALVVLAPGTIDRAGQPKEQQLRVTDESQLWLKVIKTPEELYGPEMALKIASLTKSLAEAEGNRKKVMDISEQLRAVKEEALAWQNDQLRALGQKADSLPDNDRGGREAVAAEMKALSVDYKLLPIKWNEIVVGDNVTIRNNEKIDWSRPVKVEWLMVER